MNRYRIYGFAHVDATIELQADTPEEAKEEAENLPLACWDIDKTTIGIVTSVEEQD